VLRSAAFFADLYASTYPDGIQGMVLLDAAFPDEPEFDSLWPAAGQCRVW
jgi:pimeloyl-ACP methyl ester carboxylesterase